MKCCENCYYGEISTKREKRGENCCVKCWLRSDIFKGKVFWHSKDGDAESGEMKMTIDEAIAKHIQIADSYKDTVPDCDIAKEHRQLAEWLAELKKWREVYGICPNYEMCIPECKEGYNEQIAEYKRLLKLAWDDIQTLNDLTVDDEGRCLIEDKFKSCTECPLFCGSDKYCGWRHQVDALVLLGDDENGT